MTREGSGAEAGGVDYQSITYEGATGAAPEEHAEDLHRLISELDAGPVNIFASSGGAVNALALVARHPGQVRTLVAHEPPLATVLPDQKEALARRRTSTRPTSAMALDPRWRSSSPSRA